MVMMTKMDGQVHEVMNQDKMDSVRPLRATTSNPDSVPSSEKKLCHSLVLTLGINFVHQLRVPPNLKSFKKQLKTHLSNIAFND